MFIAVSSEVVMFNRRKKTVENRTAFIKIIGLTNTGSTAQLTIPSAVNASGNFLS
jgi:hypothetical protein